MLKNKIFINTGLLLILFVFFSWSLEINYLQLFKGLNNLKILWSDILPFQYNILQVAVLSIYETLQIAFLGTFIGAVLSFPSAILCSRNLFSQSITSPFRIFLAGIRTFPALLWAIIFIMIVGLGVLAGVLATAAYTLGYLSKMFYESIEGLDPESMYAMQGMGCSKFQIIQHSIIPESANHLLSHLLFIFEYNVRGSAILGFVGAGGIGFYISAYLKILEYDKIFVLLLVLFITVIIIDIVSTKLRDKYLIN